MDGSLASLMWIFMSLFDYNITIYCQGQSFYRCAANPRLYRLFYPSFDIFRRITYYSCSYGICSAFLNAWNESRTKRGDGEFLTQVAVIEDDPAASKTLQDYLERYQAERKTPLTVTAFPNGLDIAEDYRPVWDVILLDIEMPLMDGMSAARHIRKVDQDVIIIFITNMAKYAIKGYEVDALDFVLKPVSYFAFAMKMDKALSTLSRRKKPSVLLSFKGGMLRLSAEEITYIEVARHQLIVHTETGVHTAAGTLSEMEETLRDAGLARCNKGYLVNLRHVRQITADTVRVGDDELIISRRKREEFLTAMTDYYGGGGA